MSFDLVKIQTLKQELADLPHHLYWQIPEQGAKYLYDAVARLKPLNILEIGTSSGYSALWIAESIIVNNLNSHLMTVESNQNRFDFSQANFKKLGLTSIITGLKGHAPAIFSEINMPAQIDLAFFDGTKNQTTDFFESIWPLLSPQGEILVDNVNSHREKMQPFLDFLSQSNIPFEILDLGAGICRISKSNSL